MTAFVYIVRISPASQLLTIKPYSDLLVDGGEVIISSIEFENFEECEIAMLEIVNALKKLEVGSDKKIRVLTKFNPKVVPAALAEKSIDAWDDELILRTYTIDDDVDPTTISFDTSTIIGEIIVDKDTKTSDTKSKFV